MTNSLPKISVIMASYNQGQFIEEALDKLYHQNYPNLELIVVDGDSSDNTKEILLKFENQIDINLIEPDRGMYHARNKGLLKASGEIICFLNTDDYYENEALFHVGEFFSSNPNVDVLYGICIGVDKNGETLKGYRFGDFELDKKNYFTKLQTFPDQATFIRRKCIPIIGIYDLTSRFGADANMWRRCVLFDLNIVRSDKHLANWRIYDTNLTYNPKFKWARFFEAIKLYFRYTHNPFSMYIFHLLKSYLVIQSVKSNKWIKRNFSKHKYEG